MQLLGQVVDSDYLNRPDVFRRDALNLSFQLLRDHHPELALMIQNTLQGMPLQDCELRDDDALQVRLRYTQIRDIRLALDAASYTHCLSSGNTAPDFARQWIVLSALVRDWRTLETHGCCD